MTQKRKSWDAYFMGFADLAAERSTCLRRKVGAVIVKDNRVLSTGYNGVPSKISHCDVTGCIRSELNIPSGERHELCRGLHAEQNAIIQAGKYGISIDGAEVYCTTHPCIICTKMLINAGITKIKYVEGYCDKLSKEMLAESDIEIIQVKIDK